MRVNAETKQATRKRILEAARELFVRQGFDSASTRDIASQAGIATGTLFNYFPTKEGIAMTLVAEALADAQEEFHKKEAKDATLEEELFAFIATQLRRLRPHRSYVEPVLESALSPLARTAALAEGETLRVAHLETVEQLLRKHGRQEAASFVMIHLYWSLFTGVLAFWIRDTSRHQEDTLAVLDQAVKMFVQALPAGKSAGTSPNKQGGIS